MRNRLHDRRGVRFCLVLPPFLVPVRQLSIDVVVELAGETRKCVAALGVVPMTGGTGRDIGFLDALLIDPLAFGDVLAWRAAERLRVEVLELIGERFLHLRAQHVSDIEHHRVAASALDEGIELVDEIFRLLSGKPRHRIRSAKALSRQAVAGLAIVDLGLEFGRRNVGLAFVLVLRRRRGCDGE